MTSDDAFVIALSAACLGFNFYGIALIVMVVRPRSKFAKRFREVMRAEHPHGVQRTTQTAVGGVFAVGPQVLVLVALFPALTGGPSLSVVQSVVFVLELIVAALLTWRTVTEWAGS